jgi:Flp pilus assembly protein TadD
MARAESAAARRQLLHATFRESWNTETLASLSNWLDLAEAKRDMPEVDVIAFFSQMPWDLRRELGYKPGDARWWNDLADALEKKEAWPLAEAAYRKAVELDPGFALAWELLGYLLAFRLSRRGEAEGPLRRAIEIDPGNARYVTLLGNVLEDLGRYSEAEAAFRGAIKLDPKDHNAWGWLGALLVRHTDREREGEEALQRAIQLDPSHGYFLSCLADLLASDTARQPEARFHIAKALQLAPGVEWYQILFVRLCGKTPADLKIVLPGLAAWCAANPRDVKTFDFTAEGFLQYARLTKPTGALALLEALPDRTPFETLIDTFRAHADREHLNRLAPERRAVVMELLKRLDPPGEPKPAATMSAGLDPTPL